MRAHQPLDRRPGRRRHVRAAPARSANPATGEQQAEVDLASVDEVDAAVGRGHGGVPGVAGDVAVAPQPR